MVTTKQTCTCCGKDRLLKDFYISHSPIHQYHGKVSVCKDCIFNLVDETDIRSVQDMLRMLDKPFFSNLWKSSVDESERLGRSVFRTYMKNVVMNQYKDETWTDSVFKEEHKLVDTKENKGDIYVEEDKVYSKKWLGYYYPSDIEYLEDYLTGLKRDFRILTKSHNDYAKKIAKASLHMDKCFQDMQDGVKGSDKQYKEAKEIFDTLSKSAQFSEDKRGHNDVSLGSFSQIVEMVENNTYVYEHKDDLSKDNYDKLIEDFAHIGKSV